MRAAPSLKKKLFISRVNDWKFILDEFKFQNLLNAGVSDTFF